MGEQVHLRVGGYPVSGVGGADEAGDVLLQGPRLVPLLGPVGPSVASKIGREHAVVRRESGQDVAPPVRGVGEAVHQHNPGRVHRPGGQVVHAQRRAVDPVGHLDEAMLPGALLLVGGQPRGRAHATGGQEDEQDQEPTHPPMLGSRRRSVAPGPDRPDRSTTGPPGSDPSRSLVQSAVRGERGLRAPLANHAESP